MILPGVPLTLAAPWGRRAAVERQLAGVELQQRPGESPRQVISPSTWVNGPPACAVSVVWLATFGRPRKTPNRMLGTYTAKHLVEDWAAAIGIPRVYVPEERFVQACQSLGVVIRSKRLCLSLPRWLGGRYRPWPDAETWRERSHDPWGELARERRGRR